MNKFSFVILSSHGSGQNAFVAYLKRIHDFKLLYPTYQYNHIIDFINKNNNKETSYGIFIENYNIDINIINNLKNILKKDFLLVVLTKSPLARLCSVINTHIYWFANAVTGTYEINPKSTMLYNHGDIASLIKTIINESNMSVVVNLIKYFEVYTNNILYIDISDLHPDKVFLTISKLYNRVKHKRLINFDSPSSLLFTKENRFAHFIKRLHIKYKGLTYTIKPCPFEFLEYYDFDTKDVLFTAPPHKCSFGIGDFHCDLSFVLCNLKKYTNNEIFILKKIIKLNEDIITTYCSEMTKRHKLALTIYNSLMLTQDNMKNYMAKDISLLKDMQKFMNNQIYTLAKYDHSTITRWIDSIIFNNEIRQLSQRGLI